MHSDRNIMLTYAYELTSSFVPLKEVYNNKEYVYDNRLDMVMPLNKDVSVRTIMMNYLMSFCTLVNNNPDCVPSKTLTQNGFIPIGIEPDCFSQMWTLPIIAKRLQYLDIPYYKYQPTSPIWRSFKSNNLFDVQDIWVSKMDVADMLHKKPFEVSAKEVAEVVFPE